MMDFRLSQNRAEIFQALREAWEEGEPLKAWQMIARARRDYAVRIVDVDFVQGTVLYRFEGDCEGLRILDPLTVQFAKKPAAFRCEILSQKADEVLTNIPDELAAREQRRDQRFEFAGSEEKSATLVFDNEGLTKPKRFIVVTLNISARGIGFVALKAQAPDCVPGKRFTLQTLGEYGLKKPITGTVVYRKEYSKQTQSVHDVGYRVGAKLDEAIPDADLARFMKE